MFNTILVCLDGSALAEKVVRYAADLASHYHARIILLQAIPAAVFVAPGVSVRVTAAVEEEAREYLESVAVPMRLFDIQVESVTAPGEAGEAIVRYARRRSVDLIIMSTHGRTELAHTVFGSITQRVVRESGVPVLLIRPPGMDARSRTLPL